MEHIVNYSKNSTAVFVLLSLFFSTIAAQKIENNQQFLVWQQRVGNLTDDIIKDSSSLSESEQSVYLALLAKMWWKVDLSKAQVYLQKAAKVSIGSVESESEPDLETKINNAQKTIQIINGLDESTSRKMVEQLIKIISEKAKSSEQNEKNGDMFVLIALQTVEKQPQQAFELGIRSLGFGNPAQIVRLIGELNVKNPELAERLYLAALNNAKNKYNLRFISRLSIKAFTDYKGKPLSDSVRKSFLLFLADLLSRSAAGSEQERPVLCEPAIVATPILDKFNTYLPELVQTVRQQIELCQPYLPNANSEADLLP